MRERVQSKQTETGTPTSAQSPGGVNVMRVYGNTIIDNQDVNGGITISSAGYLNLVCGKERVDLIGQYNPLPSTMALGTFTQRVFPTKGALDVSTRPGDYVFQSAGGASYTYSMLYPGSSLAQADGLNENVILGNATKNVLVGNEIETVAVGNQVLAVGAGTRTRVVGLNETVAIAGIQKVTAMKIFLN